MGSSDNRWSRGLLFLAVVAGLALCVPALRGQALALDEHVSYFSSGAPSLVEVWNRTELVTALPPLSYLLERASLAIGGRSETVLRIPSLLAYLLAIPAAWWLGRIAAGPLAGGLTATLVAWHPGVLDEVRIARCYGLTLLLGTLSMAFLLQWRNSEMKRRWIVAWTLTAVALLWTHYLTALLIGVQLLVLMVFAVRGPSSSRSLAGWSIVAAVLAISIAALPLAYPVFRLQEWGPIIEYQRWAPTTMQAVGAPWTLSALVVVMVASSMSLLARGRASRVTGAASWAALACWLLPLVLLGGLAIAKSPMLATPRYRVMVAPISSLAVGIALARALSPGLATIAAAGLLCVSTALSGLSPTTAGRLANPIEEEWKRIGLEFAPRLGDEATLVFTQTGLAESSLVPLLPGNDRLRRYVACRLGAFYTGSERALPIPLLWDGRDPLYKTYREFLRSPGIRSAWIVGATDTDLNRDSTSQMAEFLESMGYQRDTAEDRPGLTVIHFERSSG